MRGAPSPSRAFLAWCIFSRLSPYVLGLFLVSVAIPAIGQESSCGSGFSDFNNLAACADAARSGNDIPRAIQFYTQAERLRPDWSDGWWSLGLLQYSMKNWTAASDAFTRYLSLTSGGTAVAAQATALRGLCEFALGRDTQSLADLQEATASQAIEDPENQAFLRYREAMVLARLGRFEEALKAYALLAQSGAGAQIGDEFSVSAGLAGMRSAQLPGELSGSQRQMFAAAGDAALRFLSGDAEGARAAFAELFLRYPTAPNAHYLYGFLLLSSDPEGTIAEYKRELDVAPANITAASMLAWVLLSQERPGEALPYAQKAAAEAPDLPVAQLVLGRSLAETGDLTEGIEHLEKALQLQPGYLETHVALATAYARAGRAQDARRERLQSLAMAEEPVAAH